MGELQIPEEQRNKYLSMLILLFSCVENLSYININISEDSDYLEYTVAWPTDFTDLFTLNESCIKSQIGVEPLYKLHSMAFSFL